MYVRMYAHTHTIYSLLSLYPGSLQALPQGNKVEDKFTYFQMEKGQNQDHITDQKGKLGLYVDKFDGWKVKATPKTSLWDKFKITSFAPPEPIFGSHKSKHYQCAPEMYIGEHMH